MSTARERAQRKRCKLLQEKPDDLETHKFSEYQKTQGCPCTHKMQCWFYSEIEDGQKQDDTPTGSE